MMSSLDYIAASLLVFVTFIGPWSRHIAVLFGLSEFENHSVIDMSVYMIKKVPESFLLGAPYFVILPLLLILLRYFFPRAANLLHYSMTVVCMAGSIIAVPLLWIPMHGDRETPNIMGDIFTSDFVVMFAWHSILSLYCKTLPAWTICFGPLYALGAYLFISNERPNSIAGGIAVLYLCVGSLYRGYQLAESMGDSVFTQTVGLGEWYGYEIYAAINVIGGFVLIAASIPVPRRLIEFVETLLYLILLNANVAAGWIASTGVTRRRLCTPRMPFKWKSSASSTADAS